MSDKEPNNRDLFYWHTPRLDKVIHVIAVLVFLVPAVVVLVIMALESLYEHEIIDLTPSQSAQSEYRQCIAKVNSLYEQAAAQAGTKGTDGRITAPRRVWEELDKAKREGLKECEALRLERRRLP